MTADPDEPLRDSSVATKIDTPLLETPRSVSIIDRRTLDDMGAVNITQAHDYAVGVSLLDERGPAFARGFPVGFYDLRRDGLRTYCLERSRARRSRSHPVPSRTCLSVVWRRQSGGPHQYGVEEAASGSTL